MVFYFSIMVNNKEVNKILVLVVVSIAAIMLLNKGSSSKEFLPTGKQISSACPPPHIFGRSFDGWSCYDTPNLLPTYGTSPLNPQGDLCPAAHSECSGLMAAYISGENPISNIQTTWEQCENYCENAGCYATLENPTISPCNPGSIVSNYNPEGKPGSPLSSRTGDICCRSSGSFFFACVCNPPPGPL